MAPRRSAAAFYALTALPIALMTIEARAQTSPDILQYKGPDRQEKLVEGAKKEGKLVLYSAMIVNQALRPVAAAFQQKYPFVTMSYWRGDSEELMTKFSTEARANNVVGDVLEGGGVGELSVQSGLAQAMWSPEFEAIPEQRRDPRSLWAPTRMNYFGVGYNTKQVSAQDAPKTYDDLLDPKWKGKMAWTVGTASAAPLFITNLRVAWGEEKAIDYLKKLAHQNVINYGSGTARSLVDRVMAGEYAIALQIYAHHPLISAQKGAPVAARMLAPTVSTSGTIVIPKGSKNMHAALLLVDFILSKEGQKTLAGAEYLPVRSDVDPVDYIAPIVPAKAGVPENSINPEKLLGMVESSEKIIQDYFR
jgi:ABC-type Fe3+ transport system substrate-binding protein